MNETNPLEEQLQSWTPRRPSSRIERQLFGAETPQQEPIAWRRAVPWLIPATACFIAAFVVMKLERVSGFFHPSTSNAPVFFAMIGSNNVMNTLPQEPFLFASSSANMEWNVWSKASLHSTNEQLWTTARDVNSPSSTNHLQ